MEMESKLVLNPDPIDLDLLTNKNKKSNATSPKFDISSQLSKINKNSDIRTVKKDKNKKSMASTIKRRKSGGQTRLSPEAYNYPSSSINQTF